MAESIFYRLSQLPGYTMQSGYLRRPDASVAATFVPSEAKWEVFISPIDLVRLGMEDGRRPLGDPAQVNVRLATLADLTRQLFPFVNMPQPSPATH